MKALLDQIIHWIKANITALSRSLRAEVTFLTPSGELVTAVFSFSEGRPHLEVSQLAAS